MWVSPSAPTVLQVRLTEVQVLAGAARAVLGAQREAHVLNLLAKRVEGAKDLLHAFSPDQKLSTGGIRRRHLRVIVRKQLAGVDGALGLGTPLDGQWLDDLAWGALGEQVSEGFSVENNVTW